MITNAKCTLAEAPKSESSSSSHASSGSGSSAANETKIKEACTMLCEAAHPMSHAMEEAKAAVAHSSSSSYKRSAFHHAH